jgi:hypothetical protein
MKNIFEYHAKKIAKRTLKMVDPILGVIGGPTKEEAREYLKLKKNPKNTKSSCK